MNAAYRRLTVLILGTLVPATMVAAAATSASATAAYPVCAATQHQGCLFGPSATGGFEVDGNRAVDSTSGDGVDWATIPALGARTHFTDAVDTQADDSMKQGSKFSDQSTWVCNAHKNDKKDDIIDGNVAIRTVAGHQFLYLDFTRFGGKGNTFIDFEFSQATHHLTTGGCTALPAREDGDMVVSFQMTIGGKVQDLVVYRWTCAATVCAFTSVNLGTRGVDWEQGYNDTSGPTYGEAAIDLSAGLEGGLDPWACRQFSEAFMTSRASNSGKPSEVKDIAGPVAFNGDCATPGIRTTPSTTVAQAGAAISDTADVTDGRNPGAGTSPDGAVTFRLYGPFASQNAINCDSNPVHTYTNVTASSSNATSAHYQSPPTADTVAGWYAWGAAYHGNADNLPAASACTEEEVHVVSPDASIHKQERDVTADGSFVDGPITAHPGDVLEYQLVYSNVGEGAATGVTITDALPARTTFKSCTGGCDHATSTLSWSLGTVAAQDSVTVSFQVTVDATFPAGTTPVANVAVAHSEQQGDKDSNPVVANVPAAPISALHKQERDVSAGGEFSDGPIDAAANDTLEYRLVYSNTGNAAASGVHVTDAIPSHTAFVSCTGGCAHSATMVSWNLGTVPASGTRTVTFQVKLDAAFATATAITNVAAVSTNEEGSKPSNAVVANVPVTPTVTPSPSPSPSASPAGGVLGANTGGNLPNSGAARPGELNALVGLVLVLSVLSGALTARRRRREVS